MKFNNRKQLMMHTKKELKLIYKQSQNHMKIKKRVLTKTEKKLSKKKEKEIF